MTYSGKLAIRIMLIVCGWLAPREWSKDIETIKTEVHLYLKEDKS